MLISQDVLAKRDFKWWVLCFVHNVFCHPLLPIAYVLDFVFGWQRIADWIYLLHAKTQTFPGNLGS